MKKWMKWLLISGALCCVAGAGAVAAGAAMGGGYYLGEAVRQAHHWEHVAEPGASSPQNPSQTLPQAPDRDWSEAPGQPLPGSEENPLASSDSYEGVRRLQLELFGNHVVIRQKTDQDKGCVLVGRGDGDGAAYRIRQDGDELKIELPAYHVRDGGGAMESLLIDLPSGYEFDEIEIENAGGSLEADMLTARNLDIEDAGGETWISGGSVRQLDLECLAGRTTCLAAVSEALSVECDAGEARVLLSRPQEQYGYELECSAGKILLGDQEYSGHHEEHHSEHHGGRDVEVECRAGTVTVDFQEPAV